MITAKKYLEVTEVRPKGGYRIEVAFNDGFKREVDLTSLLKSPPPVFQPVADDRNFSKVQINPVGGISWECGADLSAEFLREFK